MNYLTVCCIAKNEHRYIREWVDHHVTIGAEKIVIFDNESDPPLATGLREYTQHDFLDVVPIPGQEQQINAYNLALQHYGASTKWMAFIDADECIIPLDFDDLRLLLTDYEEFGGLGMHWIEFGSSGYLSAPSSQLAAYTRRFPLEYPKNMHIKSVVQPARVTRAFNPHTFVYREPWFCVDEQGFPLPESWGPFTADRVRVHHYYYRSQQDYCQKLDRGRADRVDEAGRRQHAPFFNQLHQATVLDECALPHAARLPAADDWSSIPALLNERNTKKNNSKPLIDATLYALAANKTETAKHCLRELKAALVHEDILHYISYQLHMKANNPQAARKCLEASLRTPAPLNTHLDYLQATVRMQDLRSADRLARFIQWKFADVLRQDSRQRTRMTELLNIIGPDEQKHSR